MRNALLVGVHTNMCVLGRPFGLRCEGAARPFVLTALSFMWRIPAGTEKGRAIWHARTPPCRQLARLGKNVALVRDMTDTMYNPAMAPFVG